jgi:DNA gyrase subunit A
MSAIKGPDFPTGATILGRQGIEEAYRTGRGSITMRAVVEVEEIQGRTCLVVTELPYMVNPDNLAQEDRRPRPGRQGHRHRRHPRRDLGPHRPAPGHRAQARRRRQGRAQQPLQAHPAAGELRRQHARAGRRRAAHAQPRRSSSALGRSTRSRSSSGAPASGCARPRSSPHLPRLVKALDALDEVIALIRRSPDADEARTGLMALLDIDEVQANAILDMQLRRLAALERQKIIDELRAARGGDRRPRDILEPPSASAASSARSWTRSSTSTATSAARDHAVRRRGVRRGPHPRGGDGRHDHPRRLRQADPVGQLPGPAPRRQGRARRAAARGRRRRALLRHHDHHWLLFFTTAGRVYRAKAYELPEAGGTPRASTSPNLLAFQPGREDRAGAGRSATTSRREYLVLATPAGWSRRPA